MSWWEELKPELASPARRLAQEVEGQGGTATVTSARRSRRSQAKLAALYGADPSRRSKHEAGEAFDMVVTPPALQSWAGQLWRSWGFSWSPDDAVHFET